MLLDEALAARRRQRRRRLLRAARRSSASSSPRASTRTTSSRADQWIRIGEAIAARRNLPAVVGVLPHALRRRAHRGRTLARSRCALTDAVRLWALGQRSLRGGALARLADLRVRQGRFEEAEQLLDGLDGHERRGAPARRRSTSPTARPRWRATCSSARSSSSTRRARRRRRC